MCKIISPFEVYCPDWARPGLNLAELGIIVHVKRGKRKQTVGGSSYVPFIQNDQAWLVAHTSKRAYKS